MLLDTIFEMKRVKLIFSLINLKNKKMKKLFLILVLFFIFIQFKTISAQTVLDAKWNCIYILPNSNTVIAPPINSTSEWILKIVNPMGQRFNLTFGTGNNFDLLDYKTITFITQNTPVQIANSNSGVLIYSMEPLNK